VARTDPSKLSAATKQKLAAEIAALKAAIEPRPWESQAYPKQLPPDHPMHNLKDPVTGLNCGCSHTDYKIWILMTGRGFGKTRSGAQWTIAKALGEDKIWVAVCAPDFSQVQDVCFEGPSGILGQLQDGEMADYNRNKLRITLRNGSIIQGYSAQKADSIRGANLAYCWFDELGFIPYPEFYEEGLMPALRVSKGQMMVTTTPRRTKTLRELLESAERDPSLVHLTRATSMENWKSPGVRDMIAQVRLRLGGNESLIKQELEGLYISDIPGALFRLEDFDAFRVPHADVPELRRVVVAVDPAQTHGKDSDETGIIVAAEGVNKEYYTLEDASMSGSPDEVITTVVSLYYKWGADMIVGEKNAIGDYFPALLYQKDPNVSFRPVTAHKGKIIRAQPVSLINERGRIHMVGSRLDFDALEKQLAAMTSFDDRSKMRDDRADAWVYAMRNLAAMEAGDYREIYGFDSCQNCGSDINYNTDKACRKCGARVEKPPKTPDKSERRHFNRWSEAYLRTCPEGHQYPFRLGLDCPKCKQDPGAYLARVAGFGAQGQKSWLAGRTFR
jgi:phage terminase large subunit-like protein